MPSRASHLGQADKNERLAIAIAEPDKFPERATEWEVTMLFYSALHLVDAFLDQSQGIHPISHRSREWYVSNVTQLRPIVSQYMNLYERSLDARYRLISISAEQISRISQDVFQPIRPHIRYLLNESEPFAG